MRNLIITIAGVIMITVIMSMQIEINNTVREMAGERTDYGQKYNTECDK